MLAESRGNGKRSKRIVASYRAVRIDSVTDAMEGKEFELKQLI